MDDSSRTFLLDLLDTPSPTGFEMPGQRKWAAYARQYADHVECDAYGNTWATLASATSGARKVMLEAHADEIGFMVKHITKDGFLRIDRIGGSDAATARGRKLQILGSQGPVTGLIGNTAIHLRKDVQDEKAPKAHELYVDIGAGSESEVSEAGIRVGHPAVYADGAQFFGPSRIVGRALDNRIGGFILTQVLARLKKSAPSPAATVYAVNAVQEEIGGNGARMIAARLKPDACLVLDVTHATDTPGIELEKHGKIKLGGGPTVTHGTSNHPRVVERLLRCAESHGIPIQHESSSRSTLTDTDVIFTVGAGIPSALVSLPLRYMHSAVETADLGDVENVIALLTGFIQSLGADTEFAQKL